jgi:hypothetical protein
MIESIASRFIGAVGPAFDEDDLALVLGSGDGLAFASASSHHGVIAAAEGVIAMIHCTHPPQDITGIAALVQAPRNGLLGAVRTLCGLLRHAHPSDIDLVAGGKATDEKAASEVTMSIWVRMR